MERVVCDGFDAGACVWRTFSPRTRRRHTTTRWPVSRFTQPAKNHQLLDGASVVSMPPPPPRCSLAGRGRARKRKTKHFCRTPAVGAGAPRARASTRRGAHSAAALPLLSLSLITGHARKLSAVYHDHHAHLSQRHLCLVASSIKQTKQQQQARSSTSRDAEQQHGPHCGCVPIVDEWMLRLCLRPEIWMECRSWSRHLVLIARASAHACNAVWDGVLCCMPTSL